jgi:sugar fermentation stimulation protein A
MRRTSYDMVLVNLDGVLVSTDSRAPNKVFEEALNADAIAEFRGFRIEKREKVFGDSRLDFSLTNGEGSILLEAKSCTLVKDGFGLFPDAPTSRGLRHVHELVKALSLGRAAVLFLIQRGDVEAQAVSGERFKIYSGTRGCRR